MRLKRILIRKVLRLKVMEKSNTSYATKSEINNQRCMIILFIATFILLITDSKNNSIIYTSFNC